MSSPEPQKEESSPSAAEGTTEHQKPQVITRKGLWPPRILPKSLSVASSKPISETNLLYRFSPIPPHITATQRSLPQCYRLGMGLQNQIWSFLRHRQNRDHRRASRVGAAVEGNALFVWRQAEHSAPQSTSASARTARRCRCFGTAQSRKRRFESRAELPSDRMPCHRCWRCTRTVLWRRINVQSHYSCRKIFVLRWLRWQRYLFIYSVLLHFLYCVCMHPYLSLTSLKIIIKVN